MVRQYAAETAWQRKRRIRRMVSRGCMRRVGIAEPDRAWHVTALMIGLCALNTVLFVRLWL